jgi:hypothetical protein
MRGPLVFNFVAPASDYTFGGQNTKAPSSM